MPITWLLVGEPAGRSSEMKQTSELLSATRKVGSQIPWPQLLGWPLVCVQLDR